MRFPTKQESQLRNEVAILQVKNKVALYLFYFFCFVSFEMQAS